MKKLMILFLLSAGVFSTVLAQKTKSYSVKDFNSLQISIAANVTIVQGEPSVKITAGEEDLEKIQVTQKGETVELEHKKTFNFGRSGRYEVQISMPQVKSVSCSGSGAISAPGIIRSENIEIASSGSCKIEFMQLIAKKIDLACSGSGNVYLAGSENVDELNFASSGSGKLNSTKLSVREVNISASGSSDAQVFCTGELSVHVSGSGKIQYLGNPRVSSSISGSGSVKAINTK